MPRNTFFDEVTHFFSQGDMAGTRKEHEGSMKEHEYVKLYIHMFMCTRMMACQGGPPLGP